MKHNRMKRAPVLIGAIVLLTGGCRPREEGRTTVPFPPFDEPVRKALAGAQPIKLTVTDGTDDKAGKQAVEFEIDLGRRENGLIVPCKYQATVEGFGWKEIDWQAPTASPGVRVCWQARGTNGKDVIRHVGRMPMWVDPGDVLKTSRCIGGVVRGSFKVDRAAFKDEVHKELLMDAAKFPGLVWKIEAILYVTFDNTRMKRAIPRNKNYVFINAAGSIPDWLSWTFPE